MSSQEAILFIPRDKLLVPYDLEADDETAVMVLQDFKPGYITSSVKSLDAIFKINFGFGIEFIPYEDEQGGTVHVTDVEGTRFPLQHHMVGESIPTPASTDGLLVRPDRSLLAVVGTCYESDFLVFAGFCSAPELQKLQPTETDYVRVDTKDQMPWVLHKLGYKE